jgi:uncharacterized Zn-finger protein
LSTLVTHVLNVAGDILVKPNVCTKCSKRYASLGALQRHCRYECGKEPMFQCRLCGKKTKHKSNLKSHYISIHKTVPDILSNSFHN